MSYLIYINDVIRMLNTIHRYVSFGPLKLQSSGKVFPSNEVFIVDDVYEELELIPPANEWIPCADRMPEDDSDVLITWDDRIYIAFRNKDGECWVTDEFTLLDEYEDEQVDAWMPLPEPYRKRGDKM